MKTTDFIKENAEGLNIGDPVIITGNVQFNGKTGDIDSFGKDKRFVVVNLYNYGKHSFHSSDVEYNEYADSGDEQEQFAEAKLIFPEFTLESAEAKYAEVLDEDCGIGGISAGGIATSMGGGNGFANGGPGTISRAGTKKKKKKK